MKISAERRRVLAQAWRDYPVTLGIIFAAAVLYLAVGSYAYSSPDHGEEARRVFGASRWLIVLETNRPNGPFEQVPYLVGPFDLWNGQWWRVPISGFHHADLIHLVLNCIAIGFMGYLLEPRMQRLTYFLFFLTATTVSLLPEYLLEKSAIGLSGAAYSMFGLLLVLRKRDPQVAESFHDGFVRTGLAWLIICVFLTAFEILAIANFAHFFGLVYGLAAGRILFGETAASRRFQVAFYGAHLLIVPALYFVMHPFWIGRYHWYLANFTQGHQERVIHLERAIRRDPGLGRPWSDLAALQASRGETQTAWRTILQGLYHNRSYEKGVGLARKLWQRFYTAADRQQASEVLGEIFAEEAAAWEKRLGILPEKPANAALKLAEGDDSFWWEADDSAQTPENAIELPATIDGTDELREDDRSAPAVDPDNPLSAAAGAST